MFAQFVRLFVSLAAFKWLQRNFSVWAPPLFLVLIVWLVHGEYLDYLANLSAQQRDAASVYLAESYIAKWLLSLFALAWVIVASKKRAKIRAQSSSSQQNKSRFGKTVVSTKSKSQTKDDGFDFLRDKPTLESRADKVLQGQDPKKHNRNE